MLPDNQDDIILRAVTISANLLSTPYHYTEVNITILAIIRVHIASNYYFAPKSHSLDANVSSFNQVVARHQLC